MPRTSEVGRRDSEALTRSPHSGSEHSYFDGSVTLPKQSVLPSGDTLFTQAPLIEETHKVESQKQPSQSRNRHKHNGRQFQVLAFRRRYPLSLGTNTQLPNVIALPKCMTDSTVGAQPPPDVLTLCTKY